MNVTRSISSKHRDAGGFTLLEMMITLMIFVLLMGAVFGIMTGVLQGTSTLQDNQIRHDQIAALDAYMKKQLGTMPATATLTSYVRGDGEGLVQNGIIFGTRNLATAFDGKVQPNGYYTLRLTSFTAPSSSSTPQDARQVLQQAITTEDPTLIWTPLMTDIKTIDWKFLDFNVTQWVELWSSSSLPNLMEFSMQPAGELQPTTIDFWLPKLQAPSVSGNGRGGGT